MKVNKENNSELTRCFLKVSLSIIIPKIIIPQAIKKHSTIKKCLPYISPTLLFFKGPYPLSEKYIFT